MKKLLVLVFAIGLPASVSSYAHGIKRLTTTNCASENSPSQAQALIRWDSSVNPFMPVSVKINGEEVSSDKNHTVFEISDNLGISGILQDQEPFNIVVGTGKDFQTDLKIGDQNIPLICNTDTQFRLF